MQQDQCIRTLRAHSDHVVIAKYSPSGKFIASGGKDKIVFIWNREDGR
jgi:WD40 repeat protein